MTFPKVSSARLKSIRSLRKKTNRAAAGLFLVEGPTLIMDAIQAGWSVQEILVSAARAGQDQPKELLKRAETEHIGIMQCSPKDMAYVSATEASQGCLAVVAQRQFLFEDIPLKSGGTVLVLDGVQDPGNVGTCIRSADWFGAAGVLLGKGCASLYNDKTVRASAGSMFRIPCVEHSDLPKILAGLRESGYRLVGAEGDSSTSYLELTGTTKTAVVLGSEAAGLSEDARAIIETYVAIPRYGSGDSLNVSIAGSIILSHLSHQQRSGT